MKTDKNIHDMTEDGFRFFGKMSASATHEIKNTLAIINENIGLMDDLSLMSKNGMLSCEQINGISKKIKKQVRRSNNILQKLNKFSHSVDLTNQVIDLEKTTMFTLDLASRLIDMYEVTIEIFPATSSMGIKANQFFLENIIWKAVEAACNGAKQEKTVSVSFKQDKDTFAVLFSMDNIDTGFMNNLFTSLEDKALIKFLNIVIEKNLDDHCFSLVWSDNIE
jgi:C4-dicarboxylate-specific signal transduction histidine kinase